MAGQFAQAAQFVDSNGRAAEALGDFLLCE
jgi:hypothetical protein